MANTQLTQSGAEVQAAINKAEKLPTVTSSDEGKTLQVDGNGNFVAQSSGVQLYLHIITISLNSHTGSFYLINPVSTQITSIENCNIGNGNTQRGFTGSIILSKMIGLPFDTHSISFKKCLVAQALNYAEDEDGNQTQSCTDEVIAL